MSKSLKQEKKKNKKAKDVIQELDQFQYNSNFERYINTTFKEAAEEFIYACGVYRKDMTLVEKINQINVQLQQVREECIVEFLPAFGKDLKETIDGKIDTLFVFLNLRVMLEDFNSSLAQLSNPDEVADVLNLLDADTYELVSKIVPHALALSNKAKEEHMEACAKLIVENNKLKYTANRDEAYSWEIDNSDGLNTRVQEIEHEGVTYYSLVDDNGKIRKHKNFTKVKLEDVLGT